jgi:hypothetical protein
MRYLAKSEPSAAKTPLFLFFFIGFICFFIARVTPYMRWIFDVGTILGLSGFCYIFLRYIFTSFEYETAGGNFIVYKLLGKRRELILSVQREMIQKIEKNNCETASGHRQIHQFCPSFGKKCPWILIVQTEDKSDAWVYLACSEEFGLYLQQWIQSKTQEE